MVITTKRKYYDGDDFFMKKMFGGFVFLLRIIEGFSFCYIFTMVLILLHDAGYHLPYIKDSVFEAYPIMILFCIIVWVKDLINVKFYNVSRIYYIKTIGFATGIVLCIILQYVLGLQIAKGM